MNLKDTMHEHWERVYREKRPDELSWWQEHPKTSLDLIHSLHLPKTAQIIDIGGGDSTLVDSLIEERFENITVLDISERAIARAKARLRHSSKRIRWVVSDVLEFSSETLFDVWHDRAAFHFLTAEAQIDRYLSITLRSVKPGGHLIMGTFSRAGPKTCSGLPVHQYDELSLDALLQRGFDKVQCFTEDHTTPFNTKQNFLFCVFCRHLQRYHQRAESTI